MQILTIQAKSLKSRSFSQGLKPFNIIAGPNDSGKTAIADAVRLALIGYLPELGKTNSATYTLASGAHMSVEAFMANGDTITREWVKKGKTVKATESVPVGFPATPLVMLDAREYFGKSDRERVEMLFGVLNPQDFTPAAVGAKVTKAVEEIGRLDDLELMLDQPHETIEQWITSVADALDAAKSEAAANARRFAGTVQGIVQLRAADPLIDPEGLRVESVSLEGSLAVAHARLGELRGSTKAATANDEQRRELTGKIARLAAQVGTTATGDPAELQQQHAHETERAATLRAEYAAARERYQIAQSKRARADVLTNKLREALSVPGASNELVAKLHKEIGELAPVDVAAAQQKVARATADLEGVKSRQRANDQARTRADAFRDQHLGEHTCPTCGTAGSEFHEAINEMHSRRIAELDGERTGIASDFEHATEALRQADAARNAALESEKRAQKLQRDLSAARLAQANSEAAAKLITQYRQELEQIGDTTAPEPVPPPELEAAQRRAEGLSAEIARATAAATLAEHEASLAKLPPAGGELDEAIYATECQIEELESQRTGLAERRRKLEAQLADERTMADAKEKQEMELTREQLLKIARDTLNAERERIINEAFRPLITQVNTFTAGILPTPLEFHEGELGRFNGGSWVPVRAFGGAFTAVTYAGLQAALGASAPAKLVIVDELGRLDATNKGKFLKNIQAAIAAGIVEQFIGIDVDPDFYLTAPGTSPRTVTIQGLNLIQVTK